MKRVATAPTVYGIETADHEGAIAANKQVVATAPTVYGIETCVCMVSRPSSPSLQQHLPFTVLKRHSQTFELLTVFSVATVLTVYSIETN